MYDFCFTYPYAFLLACGGLAGYLTTGSIHSLGAGVGSGAVLYVLAGISLARYRKGELCKPVTALCLAISTALAVLMYQRFQATGKIFPGGAIMALSAFMSIYYVWNLAAGPKPKKSSKEDS